jgi:hypothetical protein
MTTRQVTLLGIFLVLAAGTHAAIEQLVPARMRSEVQPPLVSGVLEEATADSKFAGRFARGDRARVYEHFVLVEHGEEIAVIPTDKISGLILRRQ